MKLPVLEKVSECPVCHHENVEFWSSAADLLMQSSAQEFEYSKCKNCDSLFMSTRPIEEDVSYYYSSGYHPYQSSLTKNKEKGQSVFSGAFNYLRRVKRFALSFFIRNPINIIQYNQLATDSIYIDFGCGAGKSLDMMRKLGHQTIGVDFSPVAVETVTNKGHQAYLADNFWVEFKEATADFVRMNHVVEHLYHPHKVLKNISNKLKAGAVLHIAVPNPKGISSLLFRKNWHGLDCPRHVILYPPTTLKGVLDECGFERFEVKHESITKDFVRSIGYWLASKNLYELKKVNDLMYVKWVAAILYFPMQIMSFLGYGDRYHIVCYKK